MEKKEIKRYLFIAGLAVVSLLLVQNFSLLLRLLGIVINVLEPLLLGCALAYVFNIIMSSFEKRYFPKKTDGFVNSTRRPVCLVLSFTIVIVIIAVVLKVVIPEIVSAAKLIGGAIPDFAARTKDFVVKKLEEYPKIQKEIESFSFDISVFKDTLTVGAVGIVTSAVTIIGTVTSAVTNTVIGIIFAIYLLARKDKLLADVQRLMKAYCSEKFNSRAAHICSTAHETFTNFFIGQFIEAILIGTLTFIGALILRLPYAAMTGTIVGVTALIPIFGALIGAAVSTFIIFTVNPTQALVFIIFLVILQQFDNNIFYPKVVGTSVGLPGIWVLAAITVGGGLFGVMGMLLGVPLAATFYKLYNEQLEKRERALGIEPPAAEVKAEPKPKKTAPKKKGK